MNSASGVSTRRGPKGNLGREDSGRIRGSDRFLMAGLLWKVSTLLLSIGLVATAHAIEWTVRVKDAACLHENAEQYRRDLESPMLIIPRRCPDTLANPLVEALRAQGPDIHTSSEDESGGPDEMMVLDESEFACFLKLYEGTFDNERQPTVVESSEEEIMTFDTDKCR